VTLPALLAVVGGVAATVLADVRWLRVAQREHYLAGSATRFALRWWRLGPNRLLGAAAGAGVVLSPLSPFCALAGVAAVAVGPFRYSLLGRSPGPVVWTSRLRAVAAVTAAVQVVVVAAGVVLGAGVEVSALAALTSPLAVDAALAALRPVEDHKAEVFVRRAERRLAEVEPTVVAITGSFGKTTTKAYAAHLMRDAMSVVATPASFNNRAGLSRAVNEHLEAGTEVFLAEMGTYGPHEIADLCAWCPPRVAAITAIGPVHLERFGDLDAIVRAKAEIFERAEVAVLNVDEPRLAALADASDIEVVRCSATDPRADVCACVVDGRMVVSRRGSPIADITAPDAAPGNVAVAVALALAVDVPVGAVASALADLPAVPSRGALTTLSTGATAIDDTFNSNPAGCRAALATLARVAREGHRRVVVTPGMVELGRCQAPENMTFAALAAAAATDVVVVGFTNRPALLAGSREVPSPERAQVLVADTHERAVEWVRANTTEGDVVLYENQLPDHYP